MDLDEASWLRLELAPHETLRASLERSLREAIRSGVLRPGVRLPSSRKLAAALTVSRGVVSDAYAQLEAQGFLTVRPRSAPVVCAVGPAIVAAASLPAAATAGVHFDFTPTTPDVTLFPLNRWLAAAQHAARRANVGVLDYGAPRGCSELRAVLADHLGRTRGVITEPQNVIVVQGTAQGIDLVLRVLRARGRTRVAVEDPSHTTQLERIAAMGLTAIPHPVDRDGMIIDGLASDATLVTPAHQFPMGCVLSGGRRRGLLEWAENRAGFVVEDDYDSEFRYDREPVRALQGLAPDHVVYIGTVSKALAPALRLGWIVVPSYLADAFEAEKRLVDDFSPSLDQLALAEFIGRGEYDRHVRRARSVYRQRRDALVTSIRRHLPGLGIDGIAAGMHVLVGLPEGTDDARIAAQAATAGIYVAPLSRFRVRPSSGGGLVIGYGRLHESAIDRGVRALARVAAAHL